MRGKKGVVSVQLNWIFVLVIGAIILTFFIVIVQKQRVVSEENIAGAIQTDLQSIFSSSFVSTGTATIVEVPNKPLEFSCEGGLPGFKIGNQNPSRFPYAFSPDIIKSDRSTLSVFAYDWSLPFRITNFLYVTSPDVRYIIVDNVDGESMDPLVEELTELLPPVYIKKGDSQQLFMNWEVVDENRIAKDPGQVGNIADELENKGNNYKLRLIFVNPPGADIAFYLHPTFAYTEISAIVIRGNLDSGKLTFFDRQAIDLGVGEMKLENLDFVGEASVLAAIFAESSDIYKCGMNNAFERFEEIVQIYKKRTEELRDYYDSTSTCYERYNDYILPIFDSMVIEIPNKDYTGIYGDMTELESENDIALANSCPAVY